MYIDAREADQFIDFASFFYNRKLRKNKKCDIIEKD